LLENATRSQTSNWPPYNIERTGEDSYRVTMAVAGFAPEDIDITAEPNLLIVRARKHETGDDSEVLYRGIAARPFEHRFELADFVEVTGAKLQNGLLTIDLVREVPEAMKPRRIAIGSGAPARDNVRQLEERRAA
jgi:molecular chaperone IbpA